MTFLERIRIYEINMILNNPCFTPGVKVLEIGAGAGWQAKVLSEKGFEVYAIDIEGSNYKDVQIYPVSFYDGRDIPFSDNSFDIVYSSNVLEHVFDIDHTISEIKRVLKPGGTSIHLMPSVSWRVLTCLTSLLSINSLINLAVLAIKKGKIFPRHGERGNSISEIFFFSKYYWKKKFSKQSWAFFKVKPSGVLYSGYFWAGEKISIKSRILIAKILGSSCNIYITNK